MELRSLSKANLTAILKLRTAYEKELRTILREGADAGAFTIGDVGLTAMAIIQMITGVIVWFRPGRAALGGGCREDLSRHDDAARRPQGGSRCT